MLQRTIGNTLGMQLRIDPRGKPELANPLNLPRSRAERESIERVCDRSRVVRDGSRRMDPRQYGDNSYAHEGETKENETRPRFHHHAILIAALAADSLDTPHLPRV
jgi:hypothetical protein